MDSTTILFQKSYKDILKEIQSYMSTNFSNFNTFNKLAEEEQLKMYISKYIQDHKITIKQYGIEELKEKLYQDMAGFSFLTPYLYSKEVEEININSWENINVIFSNGEEKTLEEKFQSPSNALDIVRKLLQTSNMILDYSNPIARGHLLSAGNVRITAYCQPVIDKEVGVIASIRIVNPKQLEIKDLIGNETATLDMLNLLKNLIRYGISVCVSGATNSGKTTLLDSLLRTIPDEQRIFTIENNVREFSLIKRNEEGKVINRVANTVTKESENPDERINQEDLLEYALTSNPDVIVVGEMKSAEAFSAQESARTGHGVLTTIHANSCEATYRRMVTLCKLKYDMKDETLYDLVTEAFPIVVFTKQLEDKSRKIMEIAECVIKTETGERKINTLYKYAIKTEGKSDKIIREFEKVNTISESLQKKLLENGIPINTLKSIL